VTVIREYFLRFWLEGCVYARVCVYLCPFYSASQVSVRVRPPSPAFSLPLLSHSGTASLSSSPTNAAPCACPSPSFTACHCAGSVCGLRRFCSVLTYPTRFFRTFRRGTRGSVGRYWRLLFVRRTPGGGRRWRQWYAFPVCVYVLFGFHDSRRY